MIIVASIAHWLLFLADCENCAGECSPNLFCGSCKAGFQPPGCVQGKLLLVITGQCNQQFSGKWFKKENKIMAITFGAVLGPGYTQQL